MSRSIWKGKFIDNCIFRLETKIKKLEVDLKEEQAKENIELEVKNLENLPISLNKSLVSLEEKPIATESETSNLVKSKSKVYLKIHSRRSTIPEFLIGQIVHIYNGKTYTVLEVNRECVGHKFGEYSFTRKKNHNIRGRKNKVKKK
jgi:small subunit ribosomal protein S19